MLLPLPLHVNHNISRNKTLTNNLNTSSSQLGIAYKVVGPALAPPVLPIVFINWHAQMCHSHERALGGKVKRVNGCKLLL
eukprot:898500-Amphidinium_carterae.1